MTREVFTESHVQLTAESISPTLVGGGVFIMPQSDGGNVEASGIGPRKVSGMGEVNGRVGGEEVKPSAPTYVIGSLKFAADHPLSQSAIGVYESAIAKKPIDKWEREDYVDALVEENRINREAFESQVPEPQEVATRLIEDLIIRAARAGESPFGITRDVMGKMGRTISPKDLGDYVSSQLLRLALEGKISQKEALQFIDLPDPVHSSPEPRKTDSDTANGTTKRKSVEAIVERLEGELKRGNTNIDPVGTIQHELGLDPLVEKVRKARRRGRRGLEKLYEEIGRGEGKPSSRREQEREAEYSPPEGAEGFVPLAFLGATPAETQAIVDSILGPAPTDPQLLLSYNGIRISATTVDDRATLLAFNTDFLTRWDTLIAQVQTGAIPEAEWNSFADRLNNLQMTLIQHGYERQQEIDPARNWMGRLESAQFNAILARSDVERELLQSGEDLDFSENGPLRHLLTQIDEIDLDSPNFNGPVHAFANKEVGNRPGQISREAKIRLLEYLAERFLNLKDNLHAEEYEMPAGLYIPGNFFEIQRLAHIGFGGDQKPYEYITMLKKQRHYMHELYRIIPNQEQYIQWVALQVGDVGLDFVYNDIAGVIDCVALFERYAWYITATTSHSQHRILNDGEFQKITGDVKELFLEMQSQGLIRAPSGRLLTPWEAERAYVLARAAFSGMQRMGINMGWGGAPAHSSQIYRPAAQAGIQKRLLAAKFTEQGLMGYGPGRFLMDKAFEWANKFKEEEFADPENLLINHYVDGVGGISKYTAWINTIGAPDIQTNPSRSVAMTFTDIWIQRQNPDTGQWEQTTLLNVLHEIGATHKQFYHHVHGIEPEDTPSGFIGGKDFANYITGMTPDHDNATRYTFFANEVLKQRLYVSYLAQYDAMPTDLKEKLFRKMATLSPSNMISFYPALRARAIHDAGVADATWESLHRKLVMYEGKRVNDEGTQMLTYNETLKTIRDAKDPATGNLLYGGDVTAARTAYNARKATITHAAGTAEYRRALKAIRADMGLDFENFDAWETKLRDELFATKNDFDSTIREITDPVTGATRMMTPAESAQITDARYAMRDNIFGPGVNLVTLPPQEQAEYHLLTKIIDLSLDGGGGLAPVAKIVSEAKLAYKVCLDDNPRISWRASGEGGGGGGKGMIISMYNDQTAVNQGVSEHLARLLLDPINKAEEHIAGLVEQFNIHYGIGEAQEMFKPLIIAFALMVKENFWARWTGKEIRDFLQKPNSAIEEYFKVKGYSLDEIAIFKLFLNLTNHHAISNEKKTVGRRLLETYNEHRYTHYGTDSTLENHLSTIRDIFTDRHFLSDLWKKGILDKDKKGKSSFDKMLEIVGADPRGRRRNRYRRLGQLLLTLGLIELAKLFIPDDVKKS